MAFLVNTTNIISDGGANSMTVPLPEDYQENDLLLMAVEQNNNSSVQSVAGYTEITTQSGIYGQRLSLWYKFATSSETAPVMTSSASAITSISLSAWRGVDMSDPINNSTRIDTAANASAAQFGSLTTDEDNCAVLYVAGYSGTSSQGKLTAPDPASMVNITRLHNTAALIVGYKNQHSAGAVGRPHIRSERTTNGGTLVTVALNDDGAGRMSIDTEQNYTPVITGGIFTNLHEYPNASWVALNTMTPTAINSVPISSFTPSISNTQTTGTLDDWGYMTSFSHQTSGIDDTGIWIGNVYAPAAALDMTDKLFSINFSLSNTAVANLGPDGVCMVFEDSSNNWAAIYLSQREDVRSGFNYVLVADPATMPLLDSSGTLDWSDIRKIGFGWHRRTTATNTRVLSIKNFVLIDKLIVTGGNSDVSLTPALLRRAMQSWGLEEIMNLQGTSQMLARIPVQLGDGSTKTYLNSRGSSYELPRSFTQNINRRFWRVPEEFIDLTVYASADDTFRFGGVFNTNTKQRFVIHPSSSTDAFYTFNGSSWSGWVIEGKAGVTFDNASYGACYTIDLKGGGMNNCTVSESLDTIAVTTTDPSKINNSRFTSAGTGHAIEITETGTFDFEDNTFSGYGDSDTTDAAIYNNSGGAIELVIPAGDQTPTIRNGAGASTTITQPTANQSVTISGAVVGSRIELYDLASDTQLFNGTPTFPYTWTDPNPYENDREIRLRVAYTDGTTAKSFIEANIGTSTAVTPALAYLVNQVDDTVYNINGIDGSTVDNVAIDDSVLMAQIDTGSLSWGALYAYECYWLTTAEGIEDKGQMITAVDPANYLFDDLVITNVTSPEVPLIMTGGYARNLTSGSTLDVFDTGGGRIFNAPDHVVAYAVGSGVTAGDVADIADAVWDEALSGHATAGSAGKVLADTEANTDVTQAKVDQL